MKLKKYYPLLIVLAAILFYSLVMLPAGDRDGEILEELQTKAESLEKYRNFLNNAPEMEKEIKQAEDDLKKYAPFVIKEKNDSLGFSRLNSYMQAMIKRTGLEVISIKSLNSEKYKMYVGLPVQITATANARQLKEFLQTVSSGEYLITVNALDITVLNTNQPDKLRVKIDLAGYREI